MIKNTHTFTSNECIVKYECVYVCFPMPKVCPGRMCRNISLVAALGKQRLGKVKRRGTALFMFYSSAMLNSTTRKSFFYFSCSFKWWKETLEEKTNVKCFKNRIEFIMQYLTAWTFLGHCLTKHTLYKMQVVEYQRSWLVVIVTLSTMFHILCLTNQLKLQETCL